MSHHGSVVVLTMERPERLNAIEGTIAAGLAYALPRLHEDPSVRAVVLQGSGRAFCAGSDVHEMLERPLRSELSPGRRATERGEERARLADAFQNVVRLYELPKPTIAGLHGAVAGAGFALALACDFRIAAEDTMFVAAYGEIALPGDWGITALLPEVVGTRSALTILQRGLRVHAADALAMGLVDEVVPRAELDARVRTFGDELSRRSPAAYASTKRLVRRSDVRSAVAREVEATLSCQETDEHATALHAFAASRRSHDA